ncbi:maternal protein tudor isoform X2 [Anabrus simplex]
MWNPDILKEKDKNYGHRDKEKEKRWGGRDVPKRERGRYEKKWAGSEERVVIPRKFTRQHDGEDRKWSGGDRKHGAREERFDGGRKWSSREGRKGGDKGWTSNHGERHGSGKWTGESYKSDSRTGLSNEQRPMNFKKKPSHSIENSRRDEAKTSLKGSGLRRSQESVCAEEELKKFREAIIPLRSMARVELVYAANPSDFVVQISDNSTQLSDMMAKIAAGYENEEVPALPASSLKVGTPCIARYAEDNTWYRAVVEDVAESILVCFVDYGNKDFVAPADVRKISPDLLSVPILGVRCSLIGAQAQFDEWTSDEISHFMDLTDGKPLMAHFIRLERNRAEVILRGLEDSHNEEVSINQKFGADSIDDLSLLASSESPLLASATDHFLDLALYPEMSEKIEVTWFINPEQFFCQIKTSNTLAAFKDMMNSIQISNVGKAPLNHPVSIGTPVLAKFPLDGVLYRAEVKNVCGQSCCVVQYVDYGNCETVSFENLWAIDLKFMNIPRQAVLCSLIGVKPVDSVWPSKCADYEKFFGADELDCVFHGSTVEDKNSVSLYKDGVSIATELVACGLAVKMDSSTDHLIETEPVNLSLLKDQQLAAHVTFIRSISEFYVQLEPECVAQLQAKLLQVEDKQPLHIEDVENFNDLCLVTPDGTQWYRGKLVKSLESSGFLVDFVDYGSQCTINQCNVWILPPCLASLPFQATKCCVSGSAESSISVDLEEHFKMEVEDQDVIMVVDEVLNERLSVLLFDIEGQRLELLKSVDNSHTLEVNPLCPYPVLRSCVRVWIAHISGPYRIWMQRVNDGDLITKLLQDMYAFYETEGLGETLTMVEEGKMCAAKSVIDSGWYRACIETRTAEGISVCFIDYGNTEIIPEENIRVLDCSFFTPHSLAFCTSLAVLGEDEAECSKLLTSITGEKEFDISLERTASNKWIVDTGESLNLTQKLIDANLAVPIELSVVTGKISSSQITLCTSDKTEIVIPFSDSPAKFWIQQKKYVPYIHGISYRLLEAKDFMSIDYPSRNMPCVAFSLKKEKWFRAKILNISENEVPYEVQYIDYGNTEVVNSIRALPEDMCKIPPLAEECSLTLPEGLEAWPDYAKEKLAEMSGGGKTVFLMEIKVIGEPLIVSLFLNGKEINQESLTFKVSQGMYDQLNELPADDSAVFISHVNSAADFWVQYNSTSWQLDEITDKLAFADNFEPLSEAFVDGICAALFPEDEQWYRAKILSCRDEGTEVLYIDFGNSTSTTSLHSLPTELSQIPPLAKHCSLLPPKGLSKWPSAAEEEFVQLIGDGSKTFELNVLQEGDPLIVSLGQDELKVEDLLLQKCSVNDNSNEVSVTSSHTDIKMATDCVAHHPNEEGRNFIKTVSFSEQFEICADAKENNEQFTEKLTCDKKDKLQYFNTNTSCVEESFQSNDNLLKESMCTELNNSSEVSSGVFVSHVNSTADFWIQDRSTSCQLDEITDKLSFVDNFDPLPEASVDGICAALFPEDEQWYRAKILSCRDEGTEVLYIDFGNSTTTTSLRSLPTELSQIPPLAKHCSLLPPKGLSKWPSAAEEEFVQLIGDGSKIFELKVLQEGDPLIVSLGQDELKVEDLLLQKCSVNDNSNEVTVGSYHTDIKMATDCVAHHTNEEGRNFIKTVSFSEQFEICADTKENNEQFTEKLTCDKKDKLQYFNMNTSCVEESFQSNDNLLKESMCTELYKSSEVSSGVFVSHVNSTADFWIQDRSTSCQLDEITDKLSFVDNFDPLPEASVDGICAALFPEDEQWYRAKILSCRDEGTEVLYIDFGNSTTTTSLRSLPTELSQIPPLAKHCSLLPPKGLSKWPSAAEEEFVQLTGDGSKTFELNVLQEGDPLIVSLRHEGVTVEKLLLQKCRIEVDRNASCHAENDTVTYGDSRPSNDENYATNEMVVSGEEVENYPNTIKVAVNSVGKLNGGCESLLGSSEIVSALTLNVEDNFKPNGDLPEESGPGNTNTNTIEVPAISRMIPTTSSYIYSSENPISKDESTFEAAVFPETSTGHHIDQLCGIQENTTSEQCDSDKSSDVVPEKTDKLTFKDQESITGFKTSMNAPVSTSPSKEADFVENLQISPDIENAQICNSHSKADLIESNVESDPLKDRECDLSIVVCTNLDPDKISTEFNSNLKEKTEELEGPPEDADIVSISKEGESLISTEREIMIQVPTFKLEHSEKLVKDLYVELKTPMSDCQTAKTSIAVNGSVVTAAELPTSSSCDQGSSGD